MKTSLMLKLSILTLSSGLLFGANADKKIIDFLSHAIKSDKQVEFKGVNIKSSKDLKQLPNWKAYFVNIQLYVKTQKKDINISDIIFSNGEFLTKDLISFESKRSLKELIAPTASKTLYKKSHLIAGNEKAKNKLLIFSDPVCPFCMDFVPEVINAVKKYPNDFVLYYYHFPLQMHQSALGLSKAMLVAQKQGVKDVVLKTYEEGFDDKIGSDEEIAKAFNKVLKTKITAKQMNEKWVKEEINHDFKEAQKLMISGTPTLFVNGEKDADRKNYKALLKKANK